MFTVKKRCCTRKKISALKMANNVGTIMYVYFRENLPFWTKTDVFTMLEVVVFDMPYVLCEVDFEMIKSEFQCVVDKSVSKI